MTEQEIDQFLSQSLVAVIGTVDEQGRPRSAPIWFHWEDGAAYMFTSRASLKWRNLQGRPHASLCVDWREPPYRSVIMDGPVAEVDRPLYDLVLSMAVRYYGEEKGRDFAEGYRGGHSEVVVFRLTPRSVVSIASDD
ncbi:MAG: pyridoxamine 5'-phosphate oxidase family protein [Chloroflexi bacterium]|nr:pyridoxamine 5'-phosphate oxidase family protein [Chloroflexota bacterium]